MQKISLIRQLSTVIKSSKHKNEKWGLSPIFCPESFKIIKSAGLINQIPTQDKSSPYE